MNNNNLRPGVYSQYDLSSLYTAPRSRRAGAVVAKAGGAPGVPVALISLAQAKAAFPGAENAAMLGAVSILFTCGVYKIYAIPVGPEGYAAPLSGAALLEDVGALLCDCTDSGDRAAFRASVLDASQALRERIGFLGAGETGAALACAKAMDSERVVVACPASLPAGTAGEPLAFYTAAALAGTMLAADDAAYNFNTLPLSCIAVPPRLPESEVQELLAAGVTLVEPVGEQIQIVRALTTKAGTDRAMGSLNTTLIIDDVITGLRSALSARLRGSRITGHSRDSVLAQVVVELSAKRDSGIIESFQTPKVYSHAEDPTICVVELSFQVAHVLSQIYVAAHITL